VRFLLDINLACVNVRQLCTAEIAENAGESKDGSRQAIDNAESADLIYERVGTQGGAQRMTDGPRSRPRAKWNR
jgi:hypothetical protein